MIAQIGGTAREASLNGQWLQWVVEAFAVGVTSPGFALFVLFGGAIGLMNWSESFKQPAVWLVIMTPLVAATLPVAVVWRILGLVTTALATLFIGLYVYWGRVG